MSELGYVVVEYNQAGSQAELPDFPSLYGRQEHAEEEASALAEEAAAAGRSDRFRVAVVTLLEEGEHA